jgi:NAD(P)-dependent dehydrogenase (short-subunit alcohol dehydrogenase family)
MSASGPSKGLAVLVTGASRGIGLELVKILAERGERVWAVARTPQRSSELEQLARSHGVTPISVDIQDDQLESTLQIALKDVSHLDVLINNAGIGEDFDASLAKLSIEKLRQMLDVNSLGPLRVTRALLPLLKRAKHPRVAHITSLMGSISDNSGGRAYGYRMSKAALNMFNKCFAIEEPGIASVVLHPGWVKTSMGGAGAPLLPHDSAVGLLRVIDDLSTAQTGKFLDYRGRELPW